MTERIVRDNESGAPVVMSDNHHKIHEGTLLRAGFIWTDTADSVTSEFVIVTGAKEVHASINVKAEGKIESQLLEGVTATTVGTQVIPRNYNRNKADSATASFYHSPTSATGTVIGDDFSGAAGRFVQAGGDSRTDEEFELLVNTKYMIRTINYAGTASNIQVTCEFYEIG
jgi:hypothetical protein